MKTWKERGTFVHIALLSLALALITSSTTPSLAQDEPANVSTLQIQEHKRIVFEPYVGAVRGDFKVDHPSKPTYEASWTGIQFGVRAFADATSDRTLLVGFDLRQRYGWTDDFDAPLQNPDARETSLGVRVDWHPLWPLEPVFGLGWNFGDVWRLKTQEKSYTGNAFRVSSSGVWPRLRRRGIRKLQRRVRFHLHGNIRRRAHGKRFCVHRCRLRPGCPRS